MSPTRIALCALAALLVVPAAPATARSRCARLPVGATRSTIDPVLFQDAGRVTLRPRGGAVLRDVRLTLLRGRQRVAAARVGRLSGPAVPQLSFADGVQGGRYRLVLSGLRPGCRGRSRLEQGWTFSPISLPVVAARPSAYAEDYGSSMRFVLRTVGGRAVSGVAAELVDGAGAVVAHAAHAAPFATSLVLDLPLERSLAPGAYALRIVGRAAGQPGVLRRVQPVALRSADGAAAPGGGDPGAPPSDPAPSAGAQVQRASIDWSGGDWKGRDQAGFVVPGIGYGEVVCRPDGQWLRVYSQSGGREIAMMNWVKKDWKQWHEDSLREAVLTPQTGSSFQEGFNKFGPWPEKQEDASFDGIVSDRGPFGGPGGPGEAPTRLSVAVSWDFRDAASARCAVRVALVTEAGGTERPLARGLSLGWRGDANAPGRDGQSADVPGLGRVDVTCAPGPDGVRWLTLTGPGEGTITTRQGSDESVAPQSAGPLSFPLPNNGQVRVDVPGGASLVVSSRWKVNDPVPERNFCFVAAQALVP